jgi:DNA repair protein RecO (recombination protein O)
MVELITKCLRQPESNTDLFQFCEDAFIHLDESSGSVMANFPLFFALQLTNFFGFRPTNSIEGAFGDSENLILDLIEGRFTDTIPQHPHFIEGQLAETTNELLKVMQPEELNNIKLNHEFRRHLLMAFETYYKLHIQDFGTMKTLPVLREILG